MQSVTALTRFVAGRGFAIGVCFAFLLTASVVVTAAAPNDNWTTPLAAKLGARLEAQFDSSGPDAWDSKKHPLVFITSEGPGYGGLLSGVKFPGLVIYDADSREVVAHRSYDVLKLGFKNVFESHGLGVSPDGRWIYIPTGEGQTLTMGKGAYLIVNARTLKLDKIVRLAGQAHHASAFTDEAGNQRVLLYGWNQPPIVVDPNRDNRVVGGIAFEEMKTPGYLYFVDPDGKYMYATGRIEPAAAREKTHENVVMKISTKDWKLIKTTAIDDSTPVWVSFTADNKYAYISGGHTDVIYRYDTAQDKITGKIRAGVDGPYGVHLSWDDADLYTIGKGEGSHNRGKILGYVQANLIGKTAVASDQFPTDCIRGDHGTLHPDPEANEMWITCNSSFEVVIFDLDLRKVVQRLPTPNGGSTHSGSFVRYAGWKGEVQADHNGFMGRTLALKRKLLGIAPAKTTMRN